MQDQPNSMKAVLIVGYAFLAFVIVSIGHIERPNIANAIHSVAKVVDVNR